MKTCKRCNKERPLTAFYKSLNKEARCKSCVSELRKEYYKLNPVKQQERARNYRKANPEKVRDTKLKQTYGVGNDYYEAKLKEQGGVCAGCNQHVKTVWRGQEVRMALDHNHATQAPRGILCIKCNRALGLLEDKIETFENLIKYLKKYQK